MGFFLGNPTCMAVLLFTLSALAWASPKRTALDQQFASIKAQRESLQKQLTTAHVTRFKPIVISPPARITAIAPIPSPAPITTSIAALEPVTPLLTALPQFDCPLLTEQEATGFINEAALQQSLSPALLRSVIKHESGFRPCAISAKGAQGLMQLMPATAAQFGVIDPFDPRQNIGGGAALLRQLLNRYGGDLKLALSAYNAGIGRVEAFGGVPDLPETQNYVSSILEDLGMADENLGAEETSAVLPDMPQKEDFRHITLQLSLLPQGETKSSVQLTTKN
jgi:hypothetical protein